MIFLDMDGVLADFFGGIEKRYGVDHWKSIQDREIKFAELRNTDFFFSLEPFKRAYELTQYVTKLAGFENYGICTSPLRGDRDNCAYWKRRWLEKHHMMPYIGNLIITANKHKYVWDQVSRNPSILVDDKPENIKRWRDAGGIGIRYQANEDDLEEYLYVQLEMAWQKVSLNY